MKNLRNILVVGVAVALVTGCVVTKQGNTMKTVKLSPTKEKYAFINNDPVVKQEAYELYDNNSQATYLTAQMTSPSGYKIKFNKDYSKHVINNYIQFKMEEGVYPFELFRGDEKQADLVGAIAVFNVTKDVELATFGLDDESKMFNPEVLQKAQEGVLASYTVSFDDTNVMHYWLGNRDELFTGGDATVELDFSTNKNLKELRVDKKKSKNMKSILKVGKDEKSLHCEYCDKTIYNPKSTCPDERNEGQSHSAIKPWANKDYALEMTLNNGKKFQGYIRELRSNATTAFLSIPCTIPQELFDQAAQGTISKLSITDDDSVEIAQIVFGLAK